MSYFSVLPCFNKDVCFAEGSVLAPDFADLRPVTCVLYPPGCPPKNQPLEFGLQNQFLSNFAHKLSILS